MARQGYVVRLYVVDMDLEEESHCSYDSVSIFDGGNGVIIFYLGYSNIKSDNLGGGKGTGGVVNE